MENDVEVTCPFCGEPNTIEVEADDDLVQDCSVCCRPNVLHVTIDLDTDEAQIHAEFEG